MSDRRRDREVGGRREERVRGGRSPVRDRSPRGDRHHHHQHRDNHHHRHSNHQDRQQMADQRRDREREERKRVDRRIKQEEEGVDETWGSGGRGGGGREGGPTLQPEKEKEKPTLELSGKLADDTNVFRGVVIKYHEPEEARIPKKRWRFHPFKGDEALPILHLHRQSAYLLGRDRKIADIPVDHPSCSKQHAVLQFRLVPYKKSDGTSGRRVCPYIIDLGSANGTYINNQRIEAQRYVELVEKDVVKFGFSSRDYVLLHDSSDTSELIGDDEGEGQ